MLTELGSGNPDIAFGLCDLGMVCPELGSVSINEIEFLRGGSAVMRAWLRRGGRERPTFWPRKAEPSTAR
jgi:hypothetical protein